MFFAMVFTDAKLIGYLLQCHSAILVDKNKYQQSPPLYRVTALLSLASLG